MVSSSRHFVDSNEMIGKRVEIKTRHWFLAVRDPQTRLQSGLAGLAQPNIDWEENLSVSYLKLA